MCIYLVYCVTSRGGRGWGQVTRAVIAFEWNYLDRCAAHLFPLAAFHYKHFFLLKLVYCFWQSFPRESTINCSKFEILPDDFVFLDSFWQKISYYNICGRRPYPYVSLILFLFFCYQPEGLLTRGVKKKTLYTAHEIWRRSNFNFHI